MTRFRDFFSFNLNVLPAGAERVLNTVVIGFLVIAALTLLITLGAPSLLVGTDSDNSIASIRLSAAGLFGLALVWQQMIARKKAIWLVSASFLAALPLAVLASASINEWGEPYILLPLANPIVLAPLIGPPIYTLIPVTITVGLLLWASSINPALDVYGTTLFSFVILAFLSWTIGQAIRRYITQVENQRQEVEAANLALARKSGQLEQALEELAAATKTREAVLAAVSHDLRSPLAVMIGYTDLLRHRVAKHLESDDREALNIVKSNGDYLLALMDDILNLSRIESGKLVLKPEAIEIGPMLEYLARDHRNNAERKGLRLMLEMDNPRLEILADPVRFSQVMNNLLSNAVKYTTAGMIRVEVTGSAARELLVRVSDTGEGIPAENLTTIFEPFSQTDRSRRRYDSTGLGLSIVKHLTEAHGGSISVQSRVGEGTSFTLCWPLAQNESEAQPAPTPTLP